MGKRKQAAPQHASEEKRRQLHWNMLDGGTESHPASHPGSLSIIPDNDLSLQTEAALAELSSTSCSGHVDSGSIKSVVNSSNPLPSSTLDDNQKVHSEITADVFYHNISDSSTGLKNADQVMCDEENSGPNDKEASCENKSMNKDDSETNDKEANCENKSMNKDDSETNDKEANCENKSMNKDENELLRIICKVPDTTRMFFENDEIQRKMNNCLFICDFNVFVRNKLWISSSKRSWNFEIGRICLNIKDHKGITQQPEIPESHNFWLYLSEYAGCHILYFEVKELYEVAPEDASKYSVTHKSFDNHVFVENLIKMYWKVNINIPPFLLKGLSNKGFQLVQGSYCKKGGELEVIIVGESVMVLDISHPSEAFRPRPAHQSMQKLMKYFYNMGPMYDLKGLKRSHQHDFHAVYEAVMVHQRSKKMNLCLNVQHPSLKPLLRPYQKDAVRWMLHQEGFGVDSPSSHTAGDSNHDLHPLYLEVTTVDGKTLYYNRHGGSFVSKRPNRSPHFPGGILADEMGLGKTVEVLCCMLLHRRPHIQLPPRLPTLSEIESEESMHGSKIPADGASIQSPEKDWSSVEIKMGETNIASSSVADGSVITAKGNLVDHNYCTIDNSAPSTSSKTTFNQPHITDNTLSTSTSASPQGKKQKRKKGSHLTQDEATLVCARDVEAKAAAGARTMTGTKRKMEKKKKRSKPRQSGEVFENEMPSADKVEDCTQPERGSSQAVLQCLPDAPSTSGSKIKTAGQTKNLVIKDEIKTEESQTSAEMNANDGTKSIVDVKAKSVRKKTSRFHILVPESEFREVNLFSATPLAQKRLFECICGKTEGNSALRSTNRKQKHPQHIVECVLCGVSQHAECLNYDLNNPFRGEYKCPHCLVASTPVPSGATLIISPFHICHQWMEEISKHIQEKGISAFVYPGVSKLGFIQPHTLASYDIVVTTYETLRKELDYVDLPHTNSDAGRRFRHPKRFMATPSPMTAVEWWRVCLDEAQMVECITTKTAEMALRLTAVNRWCVTGTPLMRSVEDIYGLLVFLGKDPYLVQQWWRVLLWDPFCHGIKGPLHEVLAEVLWRTAKKDVIQQIELPDQTEEVCWLTFSPVEDHFYRRLYSKCNTEAMGNLSGRTDLSTKLSTLDRITVTKLLRPLLNLRQACCHPQAVRGAFIPIHESMMTMEELLTSLIKKAKLECEEAHRQLVASLSGLAGLSIINKMPSEAVDLYREVLRSVEEHQAMFRTDPLQQLHAMYNLKEILDTKPENVGPTLRDDLLEKQCQETREKYMAKAQAKVTASHEQLIPLQNAAQAAEQEFDDGSDWWLEVLATANEKKVEQDLIQKVREDLTEKARPEINSIVNRFRDTRGLQYVLQTQLANLDAARRGLITALKKLDKKGGLTQSIINQTVECCLRPVGPLLKTCPFCKVHDLFEEYEAKLFSFVELGLQYKGDEEDPSYQVSTKRRGNWGDSEMEIALKSLIAFAKSHKMHVDIIQWGTSHIKVLDTWKKEFKQLRVLWMSLREEVSAVDELGMATMRLRVRLPDEPRSDIPQPYVLEPTELQAQKLKLSSDRTLYRSELRKKIGQLMYLMNLSKSQENMIAGVNPDPCPVCQRELGREWSVLQCGHSYCMDCINILVDRYSFGFRNISIKCPMCRERTLEGEISYVSTRQKQTDDTSPSVKGSHSTKVAAVVQCLLDIKNSEPDAKALVFSSWTDVLDVIGKALEENDICYKSLHTAGKFQQSLSAFREQKNVTALLLPFHSGANGLNLIEATHVLLVEPILNPAQEAQAIGRVHRIGQNKSTKIHRFLVRRTIEERIHSLVESTLRPVTACTETTASAEDNCMTIGQLMSLFQDTLTGKVEEEREAGE